MFGSIVINFLDKQVRTYKRTSKQQDRKRQKQIKACRNFTYNVLMGYDNYHYTVAMDAETRHDSNVAYGKYLEFYNLRKKVESLSDEKFNLWYEKNLDRLDQWNKELAKIYALPF